MDGNVIWHPSEIKADATLLSNVVLVKLMGWQNCERWRRSLVLEQGGMVTFKLSAPLHRVPGSDFSASRSQPPLSLTIVLKIPMHYPTFQGIFRYGI